MKKMAKVRDVLVVSDPAKNMSRRAQASCSHPSDGQKLLDGLSVSFGEIRKRVYICRRLLTLIKISP